MKRKNRKQKEREYFEKYGQIPIDYTERLSWLYDKLNMNEKKEQQFLELRRQLYNYLYYRVYKVVLFEEPEGSPRPRFRLINRENLINEAFTNSSFVHVYSVNAKEDNMYMSRLVEQELYELQSIIYTPCDVEYNTFFKTPSYLNNEFTLAAEIGLQRPMEKPDWDNIGKKYSDMYNGNVWVDDKCVVSGTVNRFYSVLPRIEINLKYLNCVYNRFQAKSIENKIGNGVIYFEKEK